jgi:hypothetical protein
VWLVELGRLTDGEMVEHAVVEALGIRDATGRPLVEVLVEHLRAAELLLVLTVHPLAVPDPAQPAEAAAAAAQYPGRISGRSPDGPNSPKTPGH